MLGGGVSERQNIDKTEGWLTLVTLINRSLLYIRIGDLNNALHDLIWASNLSPGDKHIHQTMGVCLHK
jgi:hypothetical protein